MVFRYLLSFVILVISCNIFWIESANVDSSFAYVPSNYPGGRKWVLMVNGDDFVQPEGKNFRPEVEINGAAEIPEETPQVVIESVLPELNLPESEMRILTTSRKGKQLNDAFNYQNENAADFTPVVTPEAMSVTSDSNSNMPTQVFSVDGYLAPDVSEKTLAENMENVEPVTTNKVPLEIKSENFHMDAQTSPILLVNSEIQQFLPNKETSTQNTESPLHADQVDISFKSAMENAVPFMNSDMHLNVNPVEPIIGMHENDMNSIITHLKSSIKFINEPVNKQESFNGKMSPGETADNTQNAHFSQHTIQDVIKQLSKLVKNSHGSSIYVQGPAIINQLRKKKSILNL